jgi:hypothetical protein
VVSAAMATDVAPIETASDVTNARALNLFCMNPPPLPRERAVLLNSPLDCAGKYRERRLTFYSRSLWLPSKGEFQFNPAHSGG